ncbi:hypothetical protein L493_4889 [Bordetella bronchiseptica 99-R-0433]|nr:hypothetical protein L493_4889 [Bordetella bronchiseptica 99-R-0433]
MRHAGSATRPDLLPRTNGARRGAGAMRAHRIRAALPRAPRRN